MTHTQRIARKQKIFKNHLKKFKAGDRVRILCNGRDKIYNEQCGTIEDIELEKKYTKGEGSVFIMLDDDSIFLANGIVGTLILEKV